MQRIDHTSGTRPWMRWWLVAAGIYNLMWGAAVVLLPDMPFVLAGMEPLQGTARAIWQCLGMVIGVYGIGYLAASAAPTIHWPIVLVGFLGKVFGPIGFVWTASRGDIPWNFGWTILTNDLLWWIPFAGILRAAWRVRTMAPGTIATPKCR
jgi:small multidrug resistance pump